MNSPQQQEGEKNQVQDKNLEDFYNSIKPFVEDSADSSKDEEPKKPIIPSTGFLPADAVIDVANETINSFIEAPPPEQGALGVVSAKVSAVMGLVGAIPDALNQGFAVATSGIAALCPSFPAATLGSLQLSIHGHAHPPSMIPPSTVPAPLPGIGPVGGAGCVSVLIGGIPAAIAGDIGLAPTCCGFMPMFDIYTGSSNVFIGGSRAARMGDITRHCNPASALDVMGAVMGVAGAVAGGLQAGATAVGANSKRNEAQKLRGYVEKARDLAAKAAASGDKSNVDRLTSDIEQLEEKARDLEAEAANDDLEAKMSAIQAAADTAALAAQAALKMAAKMAAKAMKSALGKDPAFPPGFGVGLLIFSPSIGSRVLIGGFPMPDVTDLFGGLVKVAKNAHKKVKEVKAKKKADAEKK